MIAAGLWGVFLSAFVSATLLPGSSEIVLVIFLNRYPEQAWSALAFATVGNTLGGMTTYWIGRLLPDRIDLKRVVWLKHRGAALLLLSWVPVIGDALCAAAGWLRLHWAVCLMYLALGKGLRYGIISLPWLF